ncbi:Gfo/Idh/MocA family protein [Mycolicibacterium brumae]|uniref:Gfo/Idh/MocA family oxidoreductase n=1 Tax=Mycolicibacterium brumae TaxID=85968 RepID=A0A2G5PCS0_9MYCO|nr:Gfo/Idh/MocA family oxidoreductase [Mycolicibacterium brumae]MCV7191501.1 Gfo/Idh/MocA family oxidoreductase [Mycolicibacterium brumae]PIB75694.1 gfo/Idh/MocA family oxidoreductase [Mycolicibacterium brumae]RWA16215.1 hypothetical protein MBRU_08895 [Mycolicibacterium brumae DSM 44177]UWW09392.1 Gfo/Idh/MocA family oxidoreductase [Mycolicibacterium brumae]
MTLRIGVLGASRIAESAIVGPAEELGHRLVAVAARDPRRAAAFAEKYGVERVLGGYDEVIADPDVDVVYNPLANALHALWNLAAVAAGKPVLSEKPYARNESEAREVAEASALAGVPVIEAFHYLYHPVTRRLLELIGAGDLGELREVTVSMEMPAPTDDDPRWSYELAGGALMDLGCYGLHFIRRVAALTGAEPVITAARAVERSPGVDADATVELAVGDARAVSVNSMTADDYRFGITVVGSRGRAFAHDFIRPNLDDRVTITTDTGTTVERLGTRSSYSYQLEAFAAHVQHGAPLPVDGADAVANMALVDAAYRAAGLPPR